MFYKIDNDALCSPDSAFANKSKPALTEHASPPPPPPPELLTDSASVAPRRGRSTGRLMDQPLVRVMHDPVVTAKKSIKTQLVRPLDKATGG